MLAKNRVIFTLIIAVLLLTTATVVIFWARGFKPNFQKAKIERTGLIVASSIPTGARVYLDNRLTSATDTNIAFLEPKTYHVRIEKDGYAKWEKDVEVKADLATEIKALLFPTAPEIKPLTTTGSFNPTLSPDGSKIAYGVPGERGGLYVMPMSDRPFPFRASPRLVVANQLASFAGGTGFDFTDANFLWAPDSKQLVARFTTKEGQPLSNLLIDSDKDQQEPRDITAALTATLANWQEEITAKAQTQAVLVPDSVKQATAAAKVESQKDLTLSTLPLLASLAFGGTLNYYPTGLIFSPDEEKILYIDKQARYKVYDLKNKKEFTLPDFADLKTISWYPDSNHLVIAQKDLISAIEADGNNKMTVYSGKFENGFIFPHPSGTRLIILTALTQQEGTPANLYSINLK
ncbi:hypothetical protein A2697_03055 [Candidatus Curtissbacteria bacterium RIFCSPHIGHO2_01_FULL_41_44]|uniref:PEGA domain-containing protein n=1 Tax=Candidatus Curtissbacteria bacterium RIFCSPLOWO2_01_FULL_42_50 TaxID=1797730 RepID=A0A1F5H4M1_9BACT|nr:MAG: hypothetical protein A2697_03055 [Candidatus Curtissbacteria bacterium RIFCSPHIGHO2_01_FULL_41_44]OGD93859.1 MAG: hypothetical protein A3C33_01365 [Candidatus Curtissbacteria bacterium RIFCSPHIGHO2_02_FULL_42_58]OGD99122.1 MAG: hypothetical protein A3B54_02820 [Candidatus Curtissbacteria bacterium RIFCSPLOWO2_01_FULL_42_50]OGE09935.1 MAG: hypothetical protein A3H87_04605 [Candidatus Curtissbacteria bacterium RIFCSPLOWO2_02_FULL_42_37]